MMSSLYTVGKIILATLLFAAGISHFARPRFYTRLIPLWIPAHRLIVAASGLLEVVLALALVFMESSTSAAWGIIIMLVLYLVIHVHMAIDREAGMGLPAWALWGRIALQFVLIWWASLYI